MGTQPELVGELPTPPCEVTVVVPTYNHEHFIGECLDGILAQQFSRPFHVVVHDDCSTDRTPEILRGYAAQHPGKFTLILQRENQMSQGLSGDERFLLATGSPYIALCEGDDVWIDDLKLEKQWRFMQQNPWCAISHHEVEIAADGGSEDYARELRAYLVANRPVGERASGVDLASGNWLMTCTVMMRASALDGELLLALQGRQPSDFILFSLAADHGDIGFLPDSMAKYRLHGSNFWSGQSAEERMRLEAESLWFLATHLLGPARAAVRDRLVEVLAAQGPDTRLPAMERLQSESEGLLVDRAILLDRVRHLEAKEAWLMTLKDLPRPDAHRSDHG